MFNIYDLDNKIIKEQYMSKKDLNITTKKQQIINIVIFVFMLFQTIVSNIIMQLNKMTFGLILSLIVNLITTGLLTVAKKTVFEKEHFIIYKTIYFINKFSKLIFTFLWFEEGARFLNEGMISKYNINLFEYNFVWIVSHLFSTNLLDNIITVLMSDIVSGLSVMIFFATGLMTVGYFVVYYFMYVPPMCLFTFYLYIKREPSIYYTYEEVSDKKVIRYTHRVIEEGYEKKMIIKKGISILVIGLIALGVTISTILTFL